MFAWDMATGKPVGVVTISISRYIFESDFSRTSMAKAEVPAETLPVRGATELVATMPVPASPSEGAKGMPAFRRPLSSRRAAPASVRYPAVSPAVRIFGNRSFVFQG